MKLFGESAYHDFRENRLKVDSSERIWSLRVPPRVKHFVWYVGNVYLPGLALWYRYGELLTKQVWIRANMWDANSDIVNKACKSTTSS